MKRLCIVLTLVAAPAWLAAQGTTGQGVGASRAALAQVVADYWEWKLAQQPELATQVGRHEYNDRWRDWSKAARDRAREKRQEFLQQALYLGPGTLTDAERLSAHLLEYEMRAELDNEDYLLMVRLSQQGGAHTQIFTVIDQMPTRTVKDFENIVARLRRVPAYVDQQIELLREQMAAGRVQSQITVDLVLNQVAAQLRPAAADSPLLLAFQRFPDAVSAADQRRLRADAVAAYEQAFVPAWRRLESFLRDTYRPKSRPDIAVTTLPDGRDLYTQAIRFHTTQPLTAEDVHRTGLAEVARIDREMEQIARAQGFTGSAVAFERQLGLRPGAKFASQDEMLLYAREVLARLEPELAKLFWRVPKMQVGVRPIPADREASTASNYAVGTVDGSRQAWFNMNTYRPQEQVKYPTEALVLHETVPGHHLHIALARELPDLPDFRRAFTATAFSEGWALYAESLGSEIGAVYRDPDTRFGQLASEKFRAVRLVVDTGMHALGWSRERAREYFAANAPGQSLAEIDRYISWPGQALAYKMGELKIKALRQQAQQALGSRFDIRDFHDVVLRNGTLPLEMLESQVSAYIAAAKTPAN
jgi:uncharacterized protein (DUF885 family)